MAQATLSVPEIHCDHCKSAIEGAVSPIDGVRDVVVDIPNRSVRVAYDEPANVAAISAAITEAGYDVAAVS